MRIPEMSRRSVVVAMSATAVSATSALSEGGSTQRTPRLVDAASVARNDATGNFYRFFFSATDKNREVFSEFVAANGSSGWAVVGITDLTDARQTSGFLWHPHSKNRHMEEWARRNPIGLDLQARVIEKSGEQISLKSYVALHIPRIHRILRDVAAVEQGGLYPTILLPIDSSADYLAVSTHFTTSPRAEGGELRRASTLLLAFDGDHAQTGERIVALKSK